MSTDGPPRRPQRGSSRERYRSFVEDYKHGRLDDDAADGAKRADGPQRTGRGSRRQYVREYLRWMRPLRSAVAVVFVLALLRAGLEMVEPLFMRYIVDRVLLG